MEDYKSLWPIGLKKAIGTVGMGLLLPSIRTEFNPETHKGEEKERNRNWREEHREQVSLDKEPMRLPVWL